MQGEQQAPQQQQREAQRSKPTTDVVKPDSADIISPLTLPLRDLADNEELWQRVTKREQQRTKRFVLFVGNLDQFTAEKSLIDFVQLRAEPVPTSKKIDVHNVHQRRPP